MPDDNIIHDRLVRLVKSEMESPDGYLVDWTDINNFLSYLDRAKAVLSDTTVLDIPKSSSTCKIPVLVDREKFTEAKKITVLVLYMARDNKTFISRRVVKEVREK